MIFGLMPLELGFLTSEFRQSHLIYQALSIEQLERLLQEIGDYELILESNALYCEYWEAQRKLCLLQLEKKRLGNISEVMASSEDRLFKEQVLESESNLLLDGMTHNDLADLLSEIQENVASQASFASELSYWQGLSRKVRHKMAVKSIESIYKLFLRKNGEKLEQMQAEKRARELQEEAKGEVSGRLRRTVVKLSLADKIKKTALNTGIRFNIVDNYGFDNASL